MTCIFLFLCEITPLRLVTAVVQSSQWAGNVWKCVLRSVFLLFTLGLKAKQPHKWLSPKHSNIYNDFTVNQECTGMKRKKCDQCQPTHRKPPK